MSYSVTSPCWACLRRKREDNLKGCTDVDQIQEAVNKIHLAGSDNGHLGAGSIVLACHRQNEEMV
jgi:hypothetical protein